MRAKTWIPLAEAARRLECSAPAVRRIVDRGLLTVREIPGTHPRVDARELDRLVIEHTRPAGRDPVT
jgi:hypothetical protein